LLDFNEQLPVLLGQVIVHYFNGIYYGAMTYYALQAIRSANYQLTYAQLHQRIGNLIEDYPQHPQLEGTATNKKKQIFA